MNYSSYIIVNGAKKASDIFYQTLKIIYKINITVNRFLLPAKKFALTRPDVPGLPAYSLYCGGVGIQCNKVVVKRHQKSESGGKPLC